ncbi:uncharacterized protein G6M90_00g056460 [Metarhizium brunneum]|uniref:Nucleoside phosphorylase domain-containing protein n=1 Tax=Metarhizium brunneum TaxID=500148 RepID=A0A7D5Z321_9HYPO|nr:hypothetical protein G6M90_00g056460 [Metarhizium brunneum]
MFYKRKRSSGALSALFFWTWGAAGTKSMQGKGRSIFCRRFYGLSAVAALQTEYRERSYEFGKTIKAIVRERCPRDKFRKLDLSTDRLSTSEVIRPPNNEGCCEKVCGTWLEKLMEQKQRSSRRDNPAIHCGVGASGSSLRKDAMLRDKLALGDGMLCFEMEAAGLMNRFPGLVIRGIRDCADTHENKE